MENPLACEILLRQGNHMLVGTMGVNNGVWNNGGEQWDVVITCQRKNGVGNLGFGVIRGYARLCMAVQGCARLCKAVHLFCVLEVLQIIPSPSCSLFCGSSHWGLWVSLLET